MRPQDLIAAFETLAEAPDGVTRLRELVLQLAVRGRLVPQNPDDTSVSELIRRIEAVAAADPKGRAKVDHETERPFDVPDAWDFVYLGTAMGMVNGKAFKPADWGNSGLPIVRIQNLNDPDAPFNYCDSRVDERFHIHNGDLLLSWSGTPGTSFGAFIWRGGEALLNQHIFRCEPRGHAWNLEYLRLAINSRLSEMIERAHGGVGLRHVTRGKLEGLLLSLPPFEEQDRIVARVDELMGLIDRLEAARNTREDTRAALRDAALAALQEADTPEEVEVAWERIADRMDDLFTDPADVDPLRQTVLQLAVRGRLVPQDPADEPASEMLRRRYSLPAGEVRLRKIRKKSETPVEGVTFPSLPGSWVYATVDELYDVGVIIDYADGNHGSLYPRKEQFGDDGEFFITAAQIGGGQVRFDDAPRLDRAKASQLRKGWSKGGDALLTHNATVGRTALVPCGMGEFLLGTSVTFYRTNPRALLSKYLYYALSSNPWQAQMRAVMEQTTRNQVSIQKQAQFRLAVPPVAEQQRICDVLDEFMDRLDQLGQRLVSTTVAHDAFAAAAVHHLDR